MSVNPEDWNAILGAISLKSVDHIYLTQKIDPLLQNTELATHIDNLGECLLFYSIVYKDKLLLEYLLKATDYLSFPGKVKKKLKKSIFRGIKQLSYDFEKNDKFILDSMETIGRSSYSPIIADLTKEGYFNHIIESVLPRKRSSGEFGEKLLYVLSNYCKVEEKSSEYIALQVSTNSILKTCQWNNPEKYFDKDLSLEYLQYEFFHFAIEKGLYSQIEACNLLNQPNYLLKKNSGGESAFLLLFKKASFDFLLKHLKTIDQVLGTESQDMEQINKRRQTFLHLLILNKTISFEEKLTLIRNLDENYNVEKYSKIADHNDMTPLVLLIHKFGNKIQENIPHFLEIIDLISPKTSEAIKTKTENLANIHSYVTMKKLGLKLNPKMIKDLEVFLKEELIYNQKLIKVCLDKKLESLLISLLEKFDCLNFNSLYIENVGTVRHFVCIAAENNCRDVLSWFLKEKAFKEASFVSINQEPTFCEALREDELKEFMLNSKQICEFLHYSIFDEIMDFCIGSSFGSVEEETKNLLFEIFQTMWKNLSQEQRTKSILNISFAYQGRKLIKTIKKQIKQKKSKSKRQGKQKISNKKIPKLIWPSFFVLKLFKFGDSRLITSVKNDLLNLQENNLPDNIKKCLLFSALEANLLESLSEISFVPMVSFKDFDNATEILHLYNIFLKIPEVLSRAVKLYPQLRDFLFDKEFTMILQANRFENKQAEGIAQNIAPVLVDLLLDSNWVESAADKNLVVDLFVGKLRHNILLRMHNNIIKYLIQLRKVQEAFKKLDLNEKKVEASSFLNSFCKIYIKSEEDDINFEDKLIEIYRGFRSELLSLQINSLKELKKAGRLNLNDWKIKALNIHTLLRKIQSEKIKSPEILYGYLFSNLTDSSLNDYALDLCKSSEEGFSIMKAVYRKLPLRTRRYGRPEPILLNYAITTANVKGVMNVIDSDIYEKDELLQYNSPFFALIELAKTQNQDALNKILHKILTSYPPETIQNFFMFSKNKSTRYFRRKISIKYLCLLDQKNLIEWIDDENFMLLPLQALLNEEWFISLEGVIRSGPGVIVQSLFNRKPETIKAFLKLLFEENRLTMPHKYLLKFIHLLFSKEKAPLILKILEQSKDVELTEHVHSCIKFCLSYKKDLLPSLARVIFKQSITVKNEMLLQELKISENRVYCLLTLSNNLRQEMYFELKIEINKILLQVNQDDFIYIIGLYKEFKQNQLGFFFDPDFGRVLGMNGLHEKIKIFLDLANELSKENLLSRESLTMWGLAVLEGSCEIQELIEADKITSFDRKSQFNLFELKHGFDLKEKNANILSNRQRIHPTFHYYTLRLESQISKNFKSDVKAVHIGPFSEREIRVKNLSNIISSSTKSDTKLKFSEKLDTKQPKHNIYGFEPKLYTDKKESHLHNTSYVEPISARTLFAPYERNWGLYNDNDHHDWTQAMLISLEFLDATKSIDEKNQEIEEKYKQGLLAGIRANYPKVERTLMEYLERLATSDNQKFKEFYLRALAAFFDHKTIFTIYKNIPTERIHEIYKQENDLVLSLFNFFERINKKEILENALVQELIGNVIREIYVYGNVKIVQKFCETLTQTFSNEDLENLFGVSKNTIIELSLGLAIEKSSLSHFTSLLKLDPSLFEVCRVVKIMVKGSPNQKYELQKFNTLQLLFEKRLTDFIIEYDKIKGNTKLLEPAQYPDYGFRKGTMLKDVSNPTWLHLALIKGFTNVVKGYISKMSFSEKEIECALCSNNFELFDLVIRKAYCDDAQKMFSFIRDNGVLHRALRHSGEQFALNVLKGFIYDNNPSNPVSQQGFILDEDYLAQKDEIGWTIFHYVVFHHTSHLFYTMLRYIKKVVCYDDLQKFVALMGELLGEQGSTESSVLNTESFSNFSPLQYAFRTKFFEVICFANQFGLSMKQIDIKSIIITKRLIYGFAGNELDRNLHSITKGEQNEFNGLFVESMKAILKTIQLANNSNLIKARISSEWIHLLELVYLLNFSVSEENQDNLLKAHSNIVNALGLETILIELCPEVISRRLSHSNILKISPTVLVYFIEKTFSNISTEDNQFLKNIYQSYKYEVLNTLHEDIKEQGQVWFEKDLCESIQRIRKILHIDEKEQKVVESLKNFTISEETIVKLADKYYSENHLFAVKALILNYSHLFFRIVPAASTGEIFLETNKSFWTNFTNNPRFMCSILSLLDNRTFNSLIISKFDDIIELYDKKVEIKNPLSYTRNLAWCLLYIIFSFRGERLNESLSKESLPKILSTVIRVLIDSEPIHSNSQLSTTLLLISDFRNFVSSNKLEYAKVSTLDSQSFLLKTISFQMRKIFDPIIRKSTNRYQVSISDEEIDENLEICSDFVLKYYQSEDNPLVICSNILLVSLKLLDLIQMAASLAEKFKIAIKLSLKSGYQETGAKFKESGPNSLEMIVGYSMKYDTQSQSSIIEWESRSEHEIEQEIETLLIMRKIKLMIKKNLKPVDGNDLKLPNINYELLAEASYEEKVKFVNSEIYLQNASKTYFGILPLLKEMEILAKVGAKERVFKINESHENYPPLVLEITDNSGETQDDVRVLHEFFAPYIPKFQNSIIHYLDSNTLANKKKTVSIDRLLRSLEFYENKVTQLSTLENLDKADPESIDWYIGKDIQSTYHEIPYYDVLKLRSLTEAFQARSNTFKTTDTSSFKWKLSTRSLLEEVIQNLVNAIRNCLISQGSLSSENEHPLKKQLLEKYFVRKDDAFATLENYLSNSMLRNLMDLIMRVFLINFPHVTRTFNGFYVIFEKIAPKHPVSSENAKYFHLFDRIICLSHVKFEVVSKLVLIKVQYFVNEPTIDDLEEYTLSEPFGKNVLVANKVLTDYMNSLFNRYDICRQLMSNKTLINNFLDKKAVEDALISVSKSISEKIKKQINFTINYHKIYHIFEPLVEKAVSNSVSQQESEKIFRSIEIKLAAIKNFIISELQNKIESVFFSSSVMDHFATKVQLQNYLYRTKKSFSEHLQEEAFTFNSYPPSQTDVVIPQILSHIRGAGNRGLQKFIFLIQTNKELTLNGALPGQDYLILFPNKVDRHHVAHYSPLPYHEKAHFLLISSTWPNLDFCSNQVERVLIYDGRDRILDVTKSCLKDLILDLQTEDVEKFNSIRPFLINTNLTAESDISVLNLFPLFPTLVTLELSGLEPKKNVDKELEIPPSLTLKSIQSGLGSQSQLFDEHKVLELSFVGQKKLDLVPFVLEENKFSQRLRSDSDFLRLETEFQSQISKLLRTCGIKELIDKRGIKLPDISVEIDYTLEWGIKVPMSDFNENFKGILDDLVYVFNELTLINFPDSHNIKEIATILYDDIYLENDFIAFRSILALSKIVENLHLHVFSDSKEKKLSFSPNRKSLFIPICFIQTSEHFSLVSPPKEEIADLLKKILLENQYQILQNLSSTKDPAITNEPLTGIISKLKQSLCPLVNIYFDLNVQNVQNKFESFLVLSLLDILLWNIATGINLIKIFSPKAMENLEKFEVKIINDTSIKRSNSLKASLIKKEASTLDLTFNIANGQSFIGSYSQVCSALCLQLSLNADFDFLLNTQVKPIDDLTFTLEKGGNIYRKFNISEILTQEKSISATFIGIKDLRTYSCKKIIIDEKNQEEAKKSSNNKIMSIFIDDNLPEQNYYICFSFDGKLTEKLQLANIYRSGSKVFKLVSDVMSCQERMNSEQIFNITNEPLYVIADLKENALQEFESKKSFVSNMNFYSETKNSPKKIEELLQQDLKASLKRTRRPPPECYVRSKLLDNQAVFFKIVTISTCTLRIQSKAELLKFSKYLHEDWIQIKFVGSLNVVLEKTLVIGPNNTPYTESKEPEIDSNQRLHASSNTNNYRCIYNNLESIRTERSQNIHQDANLIQDETFISEADLEKPVIKKFMESNFLQNVKAADYKSICGEERIESLYFKNKDKDDALITEEEMLSLKAVFIHNKENEIKFKGEIFVENGKCFVKWRPLIKGTYKNPRLLLNNYPVKCASNLVVLGGPIYDQNSSFKWPELGTSHAFYDPIYFELELRDKFGNRLNNIEITHHHANLNKIFKLELSDTECNARFEFGSANDRGTQFCQAFVIHKNSKENTTIEREMSLTFLLNNHPVHTMNLVFKGVSFTKKLEMFGKVISDIVSAPSKQISVERKFFFRDLAKYPLEAFKSVQRVEFVGEGGIDAGGLRREFWDSVGKEFKNSNNKIFQEHHDKYFLSYNYTINENTEKTLKLFGALLAGSIANKHLIGVNFATGFTKILMDEKVSFEDMKDISGDQVFENYQMLRNMNEHDLESLEQYFTVNINDKQYELVPDGNQIKVNKTNVNEYLENLTQFYLKTYHEKAFTLIQEGFETIFPLSLLKSWFNFKDFAYLTYGSLNVTGANILQYVDFSGGDKIETLKQFFMQYISEADSGLLKNFLKFTTGSSALPYGDPNYKIYVCFCTMNDKSLPISHTCSRSIEVPKYRSYEQMKKLLTAAFVYGSEGFAFG